MAEKGPPGVQAAVPTALGLQWGSAELAEKGGEDCPGEVINYTLQWGSAELAEKGSTPPVS